MATLAIKKQSSVPDGIEAPEQRRFFDDLSRSTAALAARLDAIESAAESDEGEPVKILTKTEIEELVQAGVADALQRILHVQGVKPYNTYGGSVTVANSWIDRELNSIVMNKIDGASLALNKVTLPEGIYDVTASAPAASHRNVAHMIRLYNDKLGRVEGMGPMSYTLNFPTASNPAPVQTVALLQCVFTLEATSELILQHIFSASNNDEWMMGMRSPFSAIASVAFADMRIRKIG